MKRLNIQARGIVKKGYIDYSIESDGMVKWDGQVVVSPFWPITKTIEMHGSKKVDANSLRSDNCRQNADLQIGPLSMHVAMVNGNVAQVLVNMQGVGSGSGLINLNEEMISIKMIDVKGSVSGYSVEIYAVE